MGGKRNIRANSSHDFPLSSYQNAPMEIIESPFMLAAIAFFPRLLSNVVLWNRNHK